MFLRHTVRIFCAAKCAWGGRTGEKTERTAHLLPLQSLLKSLICLSIRAILGFPWPEMHLRCRVKNPQLMSKEHVL